MHRYPYRVSAYRYSNRNIGIGNLMVSSLNFVKSDMEYRYRQNIGPSISVIGISVNFHIGASCKTNAFQASFYNMIVKLWNTICKTAPVHGFSNISSFKQLLKQTYLTLFNASFDTDFPCTWTLSRDCSCH